MSQPAGAQAQARFCTRCGSPLPKGAQGCPQCGLATGQKKGSNAAVIVAVVAAGVLGGTCLLGILAAIAIPNFIRYQLRSKISELPAELAGLVTAEQAVAAHDGKYVALPRTPAGKPGTEKAPLGPAELQHAQALGWIAAPALYGRYAVAVSEDGASAALCAESDIDGDGELAVRVAFLPDGSGAAPAAPCTAPVEYEGQPAGQVEAVSGPNVF
jgi:type IV pilus assembly protein PilA